MFLASRTLTAILPLRVGKRCSRLFQDNALIYGLEMLAIFAILFDPAADLAEKNVTFYVDNNALHALVSNAP